MIKKNNTASETELNELDELVSQEIDALQKNNGKGIRMKKGKRRKPSSPDNVIFREGWSKETELSEHEELISEQNETETAFINNESQTTLESPHELFSDEEQSFIQNSIDWLSERDNKDMIISRIWEQITESVPESFYSITQEDPNGGMENLPEPDKLVIDKPDTDPFDPPTY